MKIYDKLIIVVMVIAVIITTVLSLSPPHVNSDELIMKVSIDGKVVKTVTITKDMTAEYHFGADDHYNIVVVKDGKVSILEADCPGQYCVKKGEISKPKEIIVCLPHKLVVELEGKTDDGVDFISE